MGKETLMPKFHQHYSFGDMNTQNREGIKIRGKETGERFEISEIEHQEHSGVCPTQEHS